MATYKLQPVVAGPVVATPDGVDITGNVIRYVGSSTPVTTGWNVNDVWIDNISASTPVVRLWTGTVFAPARSSGVSLFNDMLNGTNGATVPTSNWVASFNPGTGTGFGFTYLNNTGQLATGTGSGVRISRSVNITSPTDANISFSFQFPNATVPQSVTVWARANSAVDSQQGYSITLLPGKFFLNKWTAFTATDFNVGGTTFSYAAATWYSARLRVVGSTIQCRVWVTANAEPATWAVSVTDTTWTGAGTIGIQALNQNGATSNVVAFDNFVVDPS